MQQLLNCPHTDFKLEESITEELGVEYWTVCKTCGIQLINPQ